LRTLHWCCTRVEVAPEMSAFNDEISDLPSPVFSGMALDRAPESRHDQNWIGLLADPASRVLAAGADGVLLDATDQPRVARRPIETGTIDSSGRSEPILLGLENGAGRFAVDLDALDPAARADLERGARVLALRDAGAGLPRSEAGLAAYLTALLNWHRRHGFCANCGAATTVAEAGYSRRCPRCGVTHFPRTDPVVIMLVEHAGRLLLGRRAGWPGNRYSVLAGFVSPGESLEEAVTREVREESGIETYDPRFVTSQPWPFPSSLMLGFEARCDGGEPRALDGELEEVQWFTFDDIEAAGAQTRTDLRLPPPISIARLLIDRWLARQRSSG
jgi:NAD+ diphosphatase